MSNIYLFRRHTAADWTSLDPVLLSGELGLETDTALFKFGDGSTPWTTLDYAGASGGGGGAPAWGDITGTLADQTDLASALSGKQPLATVLTNTTAAFTTAQETKLSGIATGATANSADATLLNRTNHTGTQLAGTISDFDAAVAATAAVAANTAKVSNANHSGDATGATVLTLATVNSNVGSFGLAGSVAQFTVNAKGLITAAANVAISIAATAISDSTTAGRAMLTAATAAAQTALLDAFTSGAKGLAPASGGGTVNYLRADGSWASPLSVMLPVAVKPGTGGIVKMQTVGGATGTGAGTANQIRLYPGPVLPFDVTYTAFGINVTTAVASALARVVIYEADPATNQPTNLIYEGTDLDCSTTGAKTASASVTLLAGKEYWFGVRSSSTATLSTTTNTYPIAGRTTFSTGIDASVTRTLAYATGAPNPWVFVASEIGTSIPHLVYGVAA